nr:conserved oligomeric Golgi complex subunit 6 putativ [Albugo laibachii Nc14]|eukprot:CCA18974.1 conserved oligomeric Golgi complex subunit 6 putativ [Albugo laibachii Nc14]
MSVNSEDDREAVRLRVQKLLQSRSEIESAKSLLDTIAKEGLIEESVSSNIAKKEFTSCDNDAAYFSTSADPLVELRTNLYATLEKKQLGCAKSVLRQLKLSLQEMSNLTASVDNLHSQCSAMKSFLMETKKSTGNVLVEADRLRNEKESVELEVIQLRKFLQRFQLTEEEIQTLRSEENKMEVSDEFFRVMERVQQMKEGCKDLIATENADLSVEVMESISKYQEAGFERLCRWVGRKCARIGEDASSELYRAISLLKDRPDFYTYCKESIASVRRSMLAQRFSEMHTCGEADDFLRPIGMHDLVRYCGDLLAWAHQALVTEEDFFRGIFEGDFTIQTAMRNVNTTNDENKNKLADSENERDFQIKIVNLVDRVLDVIARPLQSFVEQTISASRSIVMTFKLIHLLIHYQAKMMQLLSDGTIISAIATCRNQASKLLESQTHSWVAVIEASSREVSSNIAATPMVVETSYTLANLSQVSEASSNADEECQNCITLILDAILTALKKHFARLVDGMTPVDALIIQLNNFQCFQVQLKRFEDASQWYNLLDEDIRSWKTELCDLEFNAYLDRWEIRSVLDDELQPKNNEHFDSFSRIMGNFSSNLILLSTSHLSRVAQPDTREEIRKRIAQQLANLYARLYNHLSAIAQHEEGSTRSETLRELHSPREIEMDMGLI